LSFVVILINAFAFHVIIKLGVVFLLLGLPDDKEDKAGDRKAEIDPVRSGHVVINIYVIQTGGTHHF